MKIVEIDFPGIGRFPRAWLEEHPQEAQSLLARCKGRYPQCLCRKPGLPLYIAYRKGAYLFARLPNTGPQHAPYCPSFEPDRQESGWGLYSPQAIEDRGDGQLNIRLGVPLLIRGGRPTMGAPSTVIGAERLYRDQLGLPGLLHLIWERSGFHRWTPRMQHRRRYRQIYKYVLEAADSIHVRHEPLTQHFFMPEPYDAAVSLAIEARRQRALLDLSRSSRGTPLRVLVCAQVRSVVDTPQVQGLILAHLPRELVIRTAPETLSKLRQTHPWAFVDWPLLHPQLRLIVLFTMQQSRQGHWLIDELAGMMVTEQYVPVFSMEEALLVQRLIQEGRQFYKPLPYDAELTRLPNFLLTDLSDQAIPLEILEVGDGQAAARQLRMAHYKAEGRLHWSWDVREEPVPPPLVLTPNAAAARTLSSRTSA